MKVMGEFLVLSSFNSFLKKLRTWLNVRTNVRMRLKYSIKILSSWNIDLLLPTIFDIIEETNRIRQQFFFDSTLQDFNYGLD